MLKRANQSDTCTVSCSLQSHDPLIPNALHRTEHDHAVLMTLGKQEQISENCFLVILSNKFTDHCLVQSYRSKIWVVRRAEYRVGRKHSHDFEEPNAIQFHGKERH